MEGRASLAVAALSMSLALAGCTNIGAQRLAIDRSDYATHLRETNKEQLLLNIVAMRYGDAPLFLEVSSVISQYTREGALRGDLTLDPPGDDSIGGVSASMLLRETPTITYTPLAGDHFSRSLLAPIPPASILAMIESGWSSDYLFRLAVRSINGVRNGGHDPLFAQEADPEFVEVVAAIGRLQQSRGLVLHVSHAEQGGFSAMARMPATLSAQQQGDLEYLVRTLGLPGDRRPELRIVFASDQTAPGQLAIGSRSMLEIFSEIAQGVDVPAEDEAGRAVPPAHRVVDPLVRIHSGRSRPADAHVAVRYRGHWFWIDGQDSVSKRTFLIAQILLSLNDTSGNANAPLVTVPTG